MLVFGRPGNVEDQSSDDDDETWAASRSLLRSRSSVVSAPPERFQGAWGSVGYQQPALGGAAGGGGGMGLVDDGEERSVESDGEEVGNGEEEAGYESIQEEGESGEEGGEEEEKAPSGRPLSVQEALAIDEEVLRAVQRDAVIGRMLLATAPAAEREEPQPPSPTPAPAAPALVVSRALPESPRTVEARKRAAARRAEVEKETEEARMRYEERKREYDEAMERNRVEHKKELLNARMEASLKTRKIRAELQAAVPACGEDGEDGEAMPGPSGKGRRCSRVLRGCLFV
jgi:hypothetical protein